MVGAEYIDRSREITGRDVYPQSVPSPARPAILLRFSGKAVRQGATYAATVVVDELHGSSSFLLAPKCIHTAQSFRRSWMEERTLKVIEDRPFARIRVSRVPPVIRVPRKRQIVLLGDIEEVTASLQHPCVQPLIDDSADNPAEIFSIRRTVFPQILDGGKDIIEDRPFARIRVSPVPRKRQIVLLGDVEEVTAPSFQHPRTLWQPLIDDSVRAEFLSIRHKRIAEDVHLKSWNMRSSNASLFV